MPPNVLETFPKARDSYDEYASIRSRWPLSKRVMDDVLLSERLQSLVRAVIPDDPRLFNEQYIMKPSHSGTAGSFGWHRDSDSLSRIGLEPENVTYMSLWIALDDMTEENGCLVVRPLTGSQEIHLEVPRGSCILMSHLLYHKSGPNTTKFQRRAWMPQFSKGPIWNSDRGHPLSLALPVFSPPSNEITHNVNTH